MIDLAAQITATILSVVSIYLLSSTHKWRNWGFVPGVIANPFWMLTFWINGQYVLIFVAIIYLYYEARGIQNHLRVEARRQRDIERVLRRRFIAPCEAPYCFHLKTYLETGGEGRPKKPERCDK